MRCNAETLRVEANVFENGGKVRFQMSSDTCGQGLSEAFFQCPLRTGKSLRR